ncbi:MAG: 5'/3'-nucleotidase SurE [Fuerstiella sp.]|nr:5'/3'-nucleotidase SurE [Fuerstiella sp.]
MRFLITNDDGFDAPGLAALYASLSALGEVDVVAPAVCHSAKGHAVNTRDGIRVDHRILEPFGRIHVAHGSPADCVRLGLCGLDLDGPDFVVAGINPGANLGVDLYYSGTVAAAREAAILGVPALAVSRYTRPEVGIHWENLSGHVSRIVAALISGEYRLPGGQFWNVNFPAVPDDDHQSAELIVAPMGLLSHDIEFKTTESSANSTILQYSSDFRRRGKSGFCDVSHVLGGQITATPVDLCNTAGHAMLQSVEAV